MQAFFISARTADAKTMALWVHFLATRESPALGPIGLGRSRGPMRCFGALLAHPTGCAKHKGPHYFVWAFFSELPAETLTLKEA